MDTNKTPGMTANKKPASGTINQHASFLLFLIPCYILAVLFLIVHPSGSRVYESTLLLGIMNTVVGGAALVAVIYIATRIYVQYGARSMLFLGSGMLLFGLGGISAGWLRGHPSGTNLTPAIHVITALASSILVFISVKLEFMGERFSMQGHRTGRVAAAYAGAILFCAVLVVMGLSGAMPLLFIQNDGFTANGRVVLSFAIMFFGFSSLLLWRRFRRMRSGVLFNYAYSLTMIAIGLTAIYFQKNVGSLLGWAGRSAECLGGLFALAVIGHAMMEAKVKGIPIDRVIAAFFQNKDTHYRSAISAIRDAIIAFDGDFRVILWDVSAVKMFGYPVIDAINTPLSKLILEERDTRELRDRMRKGGEGAGPGFQEMQCRRKDGTLLQVEYSLAMRLIDGREVWTCVMRDITERRRMEAELKEKDEMTNAFLENSATVAWMKDENNAYVFFSRNFEKRFGVSAAVRAIPDRELWPEELVERFRKSDREVLAHGRAVEVVEKIPNPDGSDSWWLLSKFLFVGASGRRYVAGLAVDISETKRAEREVLLNQEKLRSLAIELSLVEERERRKLSEYLHDNVGQMLAAAKMNLMGLRSCCEDESFKASLARTRECLEQAIASTRSMTFELSLPILYELGFNAALEWLADQVRGRGINCVVSTERKQWDMDDGTKVILFKVVRELLMNAVKHSGARNVSAAMQENGGRIEVTVADDGVGFSLKAKDDMKSLPGFGLFNIGEQVRHLGGAMHIDSHPGGGTKISVRCPLRRKSENGDAYPDDGTGIA